MNRNNFFNFRRKNNWDKGWPMSPRLYVIFCLPMIVFLIGTLLSGCINSTYVEPEKVTYYFELKLVDGSTRYENHMLYKDINFVIDAKDGAYGLRISPHSLIDIYDMKIVGKNSGWLSFGVIDFKIDSIK